MESVYLDFFPKPIVPSAAPPTCGRVGQHRHQRRSLVDIPSITDLGAFRRERVLCIVDGDNWDISAKNLGLRVRYAELLANLRGLARRVFPVAVITSNPGDNRSADSLASAGWRVVSIPREIVLTCHGVEKIANADADLCFELGTLSSIADCTTAIIGTGDGNLAISCSAGLKRTYCNRPLTVHAMSIGGATSARLRSRRDLFASSILLGMDLLTRAPVNCLNKFVTRKGNLHAY